MPGIAHKKRRLLFLTVNSSYSHSSLALPLLHAASRDLDEWEWCRYDTTINSDVVGAVRDIFSYQCDLLVADLYLFNFRIVIEILQRYHALDPECRIAVGGPECLGSGAEDLLRQYDFLDAVFRGEGENIFREYLAHFDDENHLPGVIIPAEGNAVFEKWAASDYPVNDQFFVADKPFVQIETSRGCPMKCLYCTSGDTQTRYRSLEQVREELQLLSKRGVREVRVLDRTFNLPLERAAALLKMFREEFAEMRFHLELHPQFLNPALREELMQARAGQLHVEAGIQSLNEEVQQAIGRCSSTASVLDGLTFLCKQSAFATHADLLAGLPGQRWQDIVNDSNTLMQIGVDEIQLEVLKALPGTPLREIAPAYGIKYSPVTPYDVMLTDTMTMSEMQYARDLSRLLDLTYNNSYLHPVVCVMRQAEADLTGSMLKFFHQIGGDATVVWDLKKRFLFLLDFCKQSNLQAGRFELAYQWLLAGFMVGQGPDEYSYKVAEVPANLPLAVGSAECVGKRETRYWCLPSAEKNCYLAYNRAYALNRPAAVWVENI